MQLWKQVYTWLRVLGEYYYFTLLVNVHESQRYSEVHTSMQRSLEEDSRDGAHTRLDYGELPMRHSSKPIKIMWKRSEILLQKTRLIKVYFLILFPLTWSSGNLSKGGPVILVQAENEYSGFQAPYTEDFAYEERLLQDFVRSLMQFNRTQLFANISTSCIVRCWNYSTDHYKRCLSERKNEDRRYIRWGTSFLGLG